MRVLPLLPFRREKVGMRAIRTYLGIYSQPALSRAVFHLHSLTVNQHPFGYLTDRYTSNGKTLTRHFVPPSPTQTRARALPLLPFRREKAGMRAIRTYLSLQDSSDDMV
ncbi:hypothetical protein A6X21_03125 [Planctopirus hydrillae]|uniref:Uncharacterized protein n=1 Tax=Planctopirus hydrillae TaxID=1841610 RepID=A0A1C3EN77_9PLAN|nr:hypothetical protein A6X21_03125 [Planctopirus hydrillae]